ncbi:hypothetical protein OESDEN_22223 [Oesophagostomum dentatum]|uniref:Uncharacterized protein n=1 Tax=Oesophagostomum dentatum TaxID=61180 RepID=A0A0B1S3X3_OESDE|nr:hypothetical protein OESDEN_22223 [Oesophagostomum dentatum]
MEQDEAVMSDDNSNESRYDRVRGTESKNEWDEYVSTMERDGGTLAEVRDILNTDMLQVTNMVKQMKLNSEKREPTEDRRETQSEMCSDTAVHGSSSAYDGMLQERNNP